MSVELLCQLSSVLRWMDIFLTFYFVSYIYIYIYYIVIFISEFFQGKSFSHKFK